MVRRGPLDTVRFCEDEGLNFARTFSSSGGEDTRLVHDILKQGEKLWYVPEACIQHIVRPHQVGIRPVLQRYFRIGRAIEADGSHRFPDELPTLFGYPTSVFKMIPLSVSHALLLFAFGKTHQSMEKLVGTAVTCGQASKWQERFLQNT